MAPREGFEPPLRIHRNTGLCDLGSGPATCGLEISLTRHGGVVRIEINHDGEALSVESEGPITISELLEKLGIPSSTVLAVHGDTIVPHTSRIESNVSLELIVVSSGG